MTPTAGTPSTPVVVVGSGSGGRMVAQQLALAGREVVLVEDGRVGGFCPFVACVPAKSLLLSAQAGLSWPAARAVRDEASAHRDDTGSAAELTDAGVRVLRGRGRVEDAAGGRVVVALSGGGTAEVAGTVVLATGSTPVRPGVPGLDDVPTWTSEEALSADELPPRLAVLGGGAVACELSQAFAGLGSSVVLVQRGEHLLSREPAWVGTLLGDELTRTGVDVRTGTSPVRAGRGADGTPQLHLDDGSCVEFDRLLLATGRAPATAGLGLPGGWLHDGAVRVDARCRVLDGDGALVPGFFAVGDVTGVSTYTHSANHQARTVVAELAGRGRDADYSAVPRAVYTHPPVFCVGDVSGDGALSARFEVTDVARSALVELSRPTGARGAVELFADRDGTLVGAACVGPEADSWGSELALAVRARLDLDLLAHHVRGFPTWSEAVYPAVEELRSRLG